MSNVLLVEDDSFISLFLERKLQENGHEVKTASDTSSADAILKETKPDIVLLDIILPDESGFRLLERIKADKVLKDIPVLILSNLGQEGEIEEGKRLGAIDFLVKGNYSPQEIVDRVESAIAKAAPQ